MSIIIIRNFIEDYELNHSGMTFNYLDPKNSIEDRNILQQNKKSIIQTLSTKKISENALKDNLYAIYLDVLETYTLKTGDTSIAYK